MPRGGRRSGAGRPRGRWNKRTVEEAKRVGPVCKRALNVCDARTFSSLRLE